MTFKLLIVDDEPIICKGLQMTIPWDDISVEVVDIAYDGAEAIQKIKEHGDIDIVITDVRMPNVDGLELASFLFEQEQQIHTVIISGYDDFKYAQTAIHVGVKDYLLKPVDVEELLRVIKRIAVQIEEKQHRLGEQQEIGLKNAIYNQVLDTSYSSQNHFTGFENLTLFPFISMLKEYAYRTKHLSLAELQQFKADWEKEIKLILSDVGFNSISVFVEENKLLTCIITDKKSLSSEDVFSILKTCSIPLLLVVNQTEVLLSHLRPTYRRLFGDSTLFLPFGQSGKFVSTEGKTINQEYKNLVGNDLVQAFIQMKLEDVAEMLKRLFQDFKENELYLSKVVEICSALLEDILLKYQALFKKSFDQANLSFNKVDVTINNSYWLIEEKFEEDVNEVISQMEVKNAEGKDWTIKRAEKYIQTYFQSQIKAHEVADYINISPNYFSTLFKQKTGKSFNEYINDLRVGQAKILLEETPFNVNEIAEKVGYREYKYFADVFKKVTGCTPTQYRNLVVMNQKKNGGKVNE